MLGTKKGLGLVAITLAVYGRALGAGFIWDDAAHVARELFESGHALRSIWLELGMTQQYYPLTFTAFFLEHKLFGGSAWGYHAVNVLLHAANGCAAASLFAFLGLPGAWLAGLLFCLHPVQVESVAWVSELKNVLSTFFALLSVRYALPFFLQPEQEKPCLRQYKAASVAYALALLSKTVTCMVPAVIALIVWWKGATAHRRRRLAYLLPWLGLGLALGLLTATLERHFVGASGAPWALSAWERPLVAGRAWWFYLGKLLWPAGLSFVYPRWKIDPASAGQWVFPVAAVLLVAGLLAARRRLGRAPAASALIFSTLLFPALGFFDVYPMRFSFVADHFQYLATLAVVPWFAWLVESLPGAWRKPTAVLLCGAFAVASWAQTAKYRDPRALWEDTLRRNPGSGLARESLGQLLLERGEEAEAERQLEAAAALGEPDYLPAFLLGELHARHGEDAKALGAYETSIAREPDIPPPHGRRAMLLAKLGRPAEAEGEYREALRLIERWQERRRATYGQRAALQRQRAGIRDALAGVLASTGRWAEARAELEAGLALDPEDAAMRAHLEVAKSRAGASRRAVDPLADRAAGGHGGVRRERRARASARPLGFPSSSDSPPRPNSQTLDGGRPSTVKDGP